MKIRSDESYIKANSLLPMDLTLNNSQSLPSLQDLESADLVSEVPLSMDQNDQLSADITELMYSEKHAINFLHETFRDQCSNNQGFNKFCSYYSNTKVLLVLHSNTKRIILSYRNRVRT